MNLRKEKDKMFSEVKYSYFLMIIALFSVQSIAYSQLNFNEALTKAKDENKKVIVDVYTDWCGWCKKMDAEAYKNSDVKKIIEENFVFVKLNAEGTNKVTYKGKQYTEQDLAALFEVTGYPTTVFLEPDGKQIEYKYDSMKMKNLPGYFKTDEFKKILEYFKDNKYKESDLSLVI
jgi:thioredoxin-related protein